ncbi:MAG: GAF domain-containing protein [Anaerolineae bacterium]|nr:GAF domain-containing protein [Anaerolineae bacterium]
MIHSTIEKEAAINQSKNLLKLLVISSDEKIYKTIQRALKQAVNMKFDVSWATNYQENNLGQYDILIIDYYLGQDTALDILRRPSENRHHLPTIVLFEDLDPALFSEAEQAGALDCLVKNQLGSQLLERSIRCAIRRPLESNLPDIEPEDDLPQYYAALEQRYSEQATELAYIKSVSEDEHSRRQELEQWVKESLTRRARQVQTVTYIAQKIATTPKLDDLFMQVVNLVQQQFGYYHAHIYTLEGDYLMLKEGTGNVGQMMKAVNHKIPVIALKSLVARAAQTGYPVLIEDVTHDPGWLPNSLLPETKAEIAVPIKLGEDILGVLDVQNDTIGSLDEEDQILLMGLCGQIAVAINNRRLDDRRQEAEDNQRRLIQELDAFAHTIGYTLRDPVSLIIGYTELLRSQSGLSDTLHEYLNSIARNGLKMSNIIDELQVLTGVRRAKIVPKPLSMLRIVAEVQQRLAHLIQEHDAKIIVSEYWPAAIGHKPWIEEVWANYLSNAIKHGGQPPRIYVGATEQSDGMIRFWVRDNGPGFTPEEQAQFFTEFTNLSQRRVTEYSLGLAIVKRIVTKLGGEVGVESDGIPGEGTIFTFTLPKA